MMTILTPFFAGIARGVGVHGWHKAALMVGVALVSIVGPFGHFESEASS